MFDIVNLIIIPLFATIVVRIVGLKYRNITFHITLFSLLLVLFIATFNLFNIDVVSYVMGGFSAYKGIELVGSKFSYALISAITLAALLSLINSSAVIDRHFNLKKVNYYSLYLLAMSGFIGLCLTNDLFNLYVFLEVTSLSSYALLSLGNKRSYLSSFNYLLIGSVGASFYLLSIGYLYSITGSLNFTEVSNIIINLDSSIIKNIAFAFFIVGIFIKMAVFPFHFWLPNSYHYAINPVSSLFASVGTKVSAFIFIKILLGIYGITFITQNYDLHLLLEILVSLAIIFGGCFALIQNRIKRLITYIIVIEIGYIVAGMIIGTDLSIKASMYHIISDVFITLGLFLFVTILSFIVSDKHTVNLNYSQLYQCFKKSKLASWGFIIIMLVVIGLPPTPGFISKWLLLTSAYSAESYIIFGSLIFSSIVTVVIFFRILESMLFKTEFSNELTVRKVNFSMVLPLYVVIFILAILSIYSNELFENVINPFIERI